MTPHDPSSTSRDRRCTWLVGAAAGALLSVGVPFGIPSSAGIAGALRVLDGGWPCRDFWTIYAPGHFWLLAGLFALFGRQLLVAALAAVVLEAAACALFFRLLRRLDVERRFAALAALAFAGTLLKTAPTLTTYPPLLVAGLLGITRTIAAAATPTRRNALMAGAWFGVAAWFKHDVAAYLAVAACAGLAAATARRPRREVATAAGFFAAGAVAAALPVALLLAAAGGRDAWNDLVVFPLTDFPTTRPQTYPMLVESWRASVGASRRVGALLEWVRHWMPVWTWLVLLATTWRRRSVSSPARLAAAVAALVALPLFFAAAHVQINTHILSMGAVVIGALAVEWPTRPARVAAALLCAAALANAPARMLARAVDVARTGRTIDVPGAAGIVASAREAGEVEVVARLVRELTAPGEPIYVGVARHDAVVISRPELYLLFDRPCATRYAELHPGIVDREEVQREIQADLDRRRVRVVVLWHVGWSDDRFDEIRAQRRRLLPGTGATLLDDALQRDFAQVAQFGELEVRVRR